MSGPVAASAGILKPVLQALAAYTRLVDTKGPKSRARSGLTYLLVQSLIQGLSKMQSNRHGTGGTRQNTSLDH